MCLHPVLFCALSPYLSKQPHKPSCVAVAMWLLLTLRCADLAERKSEKDSKNTEYCATLRFTDFWTDQKCKYKSYFNCRRVLQGVFVYRPPPSLPLSLSVPVSVCLYVHLSVCLSVCLSVSVSVSVCLSVCLPACLSLSFLLCYFKNKNNGNVRVA